jgi:hypothetical protein
MKIHKYKNITQKNSLFFNISLFSMIFNLFMIHDFAFLRPYET